MGVRSFRYSVRKYLAFSRNEVSGFFATVLVFAFIYSFDMWGGAHFDIAVGLRNFFAALLLMALCVAVHHLAQKLVALRYGYAAEITIWWYGLLGGLLLVIFTNGWLKVFAATGMFLSAIPTLRLGYKKPGVNVKQLGICALAGPVANALLGIIGKLFASATGLSPTAGDAFFAFNMLYAAYSLLPIPPLDGSRVFFFSRLTYVFVFCSVIGYVLLAYIAGIFSIFWALVVGAVCWLLFYIFFESKLVAG